ncbi:alpha/beta fold hydrolase [Corynebacterium lubricantis]|uniref:alpha/beta fold hydrolase n=1 Tax=Corynebacterium lubricantis TaxID=541095 RepID=UPI000374FE0E|nr:alpha/beta hydrolase [Corynebacterium lubricantis]
MAVVFLGSAGQLADSWAGVVGHLTEKPYIPVLEGNSFHQRADALEDYLDKHELRRPTLVGHGIGAMTALQVAARRPVERLVLSNPQLTLDKNAVDKQKKALKWVPKFMLKSVGADKEQFRAALDEAGQIDLRREAMLVEAPTLVLGADDAAREVAQVIHGAEYREVAASGDWYVTDPDRFVAEAGLR